MTRRGKEMKKRGGERDKVKKRKEIIKDHTGVCVGGMKK